MANKQTLKVVKIGGHIVEDPDMLAEFLAEFARIKEPKILVHGGGKILTHMAEKLHIPTQMINGRRITDTATLEVAIMVYGGLANKTIVSKLQALQCNALGVSGADGNVVLAEKRPITDVDYGWVGDITKVNTPFLNHLLKADLVPVFCSLTHNGNGQLLNTNADTMAAFIAASLSTHFEVILYYIFEKPGVLNDLSDEHSIISEIDTNSYQKLLEGRIISHGMLPKMQNSFWALQNNVKKVCIGNWKMISEQHASTHTTLIL